MQEMDMCPLPIINVSTLPNNCSYENWVWNITGIDIWLEDLGVSVECLTMPCLALMKLTFSNISTLIVQLRSFSIPFTGTLFSRVFLDRFLLSSTFKLCNSIVVADH